MKTSKVLSLVMAVSLVLTAKLLAGDIPAANPFFGTLSTVNPAELPAKSAELVLQADAKTRLETAANVVKAAVGLNRGGGGDCGNHRPVSAGSGFSGSRHGGGVGARSGRCHRSCRCGRGSVQSRQNC